MTARANCGKLRKPTVEEIIKEKTQGKEVGLMDLDSILVLYSPARTGGPTQPYAHD